VQQQSSYLYPVPDVDRHNWASPELSDYARSVADDDGAQLAVVAYSPLLQGAFVREDKPLWEGYDHPTSRARLATLHDVARDLGATAHQVALAWLLGGQAPALPIVGASSVAQLDEALGAVDLVLDGDVRARLDAV